MLASIDQPYRDLIIHLLGEFHHYPFERYTPLLTESLRSIDNGRHGRFKYLAVRPVISAEDKRSGKIKSGDVLAYPLKALLKERLPGSQVVDTVRKFESRIYHDPSAALVFVDDYIGTGESVVTVLNEYSPQSHPLAAPPMVVTLVINGVGLELLRSKNIEVHFAIKTERGISNSRTLSNVSAAKKLMEDLEDDIVTKEIFRFGFGQCEDLVKMIRTPNNTFPVFWATKDKDGRPRSAPFPRN
jgi:hypothetical protein